MNPRSAQCAEIRALLPELALGIADGEERASALEHLGGCADCRRELDELSAIADELVALAPEREPPAGFEGRVIERLRVRAAPTRPAPARAARPQASELRRGRAGGGGGNRCGDDGFVQLRSPPCRSV